MVKGLNISQLFFQEGRSFLLKPTRTLWTGRLSHAATSARMFTLINGPFSVLFLPGPTVPIVVFEAASTIEK
jgi:hypothetical protein